VDLSEQDGQTRVSIADSGPGIPEQEREKVFRRFYRLEQSRGQPGNGLGLSLVAAVARLHDVNLWTEDNAPGLRVEMKFTRSSG
jgi:signal transduction histidine kinase